MTFWVSVGVIWAMQVLAWIPASILQTEKFYDLTGSLTYIVVTLLSLQNVNDPSWRHLFIAAAKLLWAARLGAFLFSRALQHEDVRFRNVKVKPLMFLFYWLMQALWCTVTSLPVALVLNSDAPLANELSQDATVLEMAAIGLFVVGFLFEAIADWQKRRFKAQANNKDKFICNGLWSISRHPNYFGEILLHIGIALFAFVNLTSPIAWLAFISPIFITWLLLRVSGVPLLERIGDKRYGSLASYQQYKAKTAVLVPFLY